LRPVLLDTGVIVAFLDRSERMHKICAEALETLASPLVTCEAVITEACHLLRKVPGAPEAVVENVVAGIFQIPFQLSRTASPVQHVLRKYRDREIDLAGACLIHLAAELRTGQILTLDRDFEIFRWGGNKRFEILTPLPS
jgi:uncharacterized protein